MIFSTQDASLLNGIQFELQTEPLLVVGEFRCRLGV